MITHLPRHGLFALIFIGTSLSACDRSTPSSPAPAPATTEATAPAQLPPSESPAPPTAPTAAPQNARDTPERKYNAANARGICQASCVWAADHRDILPDHLGQLLAANYISRKQLLCKPFTTAPVSLTPELLEKSKSDFAAFAQEVDAHCDFVYLGAGLTNQVASDLVLLYQKPTPDTADGLIVGFQDGHSEFVTTAALPAIFKATNKMLAKAGKTPVDTDALVHPQPVQP